MDMAMMAGTTRAKEKTKKGRLAAVVCRQMVSSESGRVAVVAHPRALLERRWSCYGNK
jgi:hypothetical protein